MHTLSSILLSAPHSNGLVNELAATLESHLARKTGLSGMAMKLGFNTLKAARPDVSRRAAEVLLPDVARALDPLYAEFLQGGHPDFAAFLTANNHRATALTVTAIDTRMRQINNTAAQSIYRRFSGSAAAELQKLLPACAQVLARHLA